MEISDFKNILFNRILSPEKFMNVLENLYLILQSNNKVIKIFAKIRLLIIDSIGGIFRSGDDLCNRTKMIIKCGQLLVDIAREYNLSV